MPVDPRYRPDPRFQSLGPEFADPVRPADFPERRLRWRNQRWAEAVGLGGLDPAEWIRAFGRFEPLPDNQAEPLAMRYHGHQFQVYNPELGDGRGFLFAQLRDEQGRLLDLGTKGSGTTPWSRAGDGRLTLKGAVREMLAAAMLEAQGVPTCKILSVVETGEALVRGDEPSPTRSAVLTRLSHSHVRFGTFQRLAYLERDDLSAVLLEHVRDAYHPDLQGLGTAEATLEVFDRITTASARLVAAWMAAGFVHGVLNTDNMNINGESFDYGPYRFLPRNDPNFTAAYFDHAGLYAFGRQASAVFWNLQQLAGALRPLTEAAALVEALRTFPERYREALAARMLDRLGLEPEGPEADAALVNAAFRALAEGGERLRWEPFFFDWRGGAASEARALEGPRGGLYAGEAFREFRTRLQERTPRDAWRLSSPYFAGREPEELLYDEIEEIWSDISARDDWSRAERKLAALEAARVATQAPRPAVAPGA